MVTPRLRTHHMRNPQDVLAARVDHLTRQLLDAQIEQLELQLGGLKEQRRLLNGGHEAGRGKKPARGPTEGTAGAKILDLLKSAAAPMGLSEISKTLKLPSGNVSVALTSLKRRGLIHHRITDKKWERK